jgi:hypothetical protein
VLLNAKGFERAPFILTIKDFKMSIINKDEIFIVAHRITGDEISIEQFKVYKAWLKTKPSFVQIEDSEWEDWRGIQCTCMDEFEFEDEDEFKFEDEF